MTVQGIKSLLAKPGKVYVAALMGENVEYVQAVKSDVLRALNSMPDSNEIDCFYNDAGDICIG